MSGQAETTTTDTAEMPAPVVRDDRADALALLTDEEREALNMELDGEDAAPAGDDDEDDGDDDQDDAAAAGADDAGPAPVQAAAPVEAPMLAPSYDYKLPDDFEEQRTTLEGRYADLDQRLEDGEVTSAEYSRELRALGREQSKLDGMQQRADIAAEMREQAAQAAHQRENQSWIDAIDTLVKEVKGQAVEGEPNYADDEKAGYQLGMQVQAVMASRGFDAGAVVPDADKLDMLRQARRELYYRQTGKVLPDDSAKVTDEARTAAKRAKAESRKPSFDGIVQPVSALPGAGGSSGEEAEFASIISLEGEAFDTAVSALRARDPAKYARFLAS